MLDKICHIFIVYLNYLFLDVVENSLLAEIWAGQNTRETFVRLRKVEFEIDDGKTNLR